MITTNIFGTHESDSNILSDNEQSTDISYQSTQYSLSSFGTSSFDIFHNALTEDCSDKRHVEHTRIREHECAMRIASVALPFLAEHRSPFPQELIRKQLLHARADMSNQCQHLCMVAHQVSKPSVFQ